MSKKANYFFISLKACIKAFFSFGIIFVLMLSCVFSLIWFISSTVYKNDILKPVTVAVVKNGDEAETNIALKFIKATDSVLSVCKLTEMEKSNAESAFKNGDVSGIIYLKENFAHGVYRGEYNELDVTLRDNGSIAVNVLKELLKSGEAYIALTEAGVYAISDTAAVYGSKISDGELRKAVTKKYMQIILARGGLFSSETLSAFENTDIISYYISAGIVLWQLFIGVAFLFLYNKEHCSFERRLKAAGINKISCGIIKLLNISIILFASSVTIIQLIGVLSPNFTDILGSKRLDEKVVSYLILLTVSLCIASFIHFFGSAFGKIGLSELMYIFASVVLILVGGYILPKAFISNTLNDLNSFSPAVFWHSSALTALYSYGNISMALKNILLGGVFFLSGEALR